jgi:hypothetical protein
MGEGSRETGEELEAEKKQVASETKRNEAGKRLLFLFFHDGVNKNFWQFKKQVGSETKASGGGQGYFFF